MAASLIARLARGSKPSLMAEILGRMDVKACCTARRGRCTAAGVAPPSLPEPLPWGRRHPDGVLVRPAAWSSIRCIVSASAPVSSTHGARPVQVQQKRLRLALAPRRPAVRVLCPGAGALGCVPGIGDRLPQEGRDETQVGAMGVLPGIIGVLTGLVLGGTVVACHRSLLVQLPLHLIYLESCANKTSARFRSDADP